MAGQMRFMDDEVSSSMGLFSNEAGRGSFKPGQYCEWFGLYVPSSVSAFCSTGDHIEQGVGCQDAATRDGVYLWSFGR